MNTNPCTIGNKHTLLFFSPRGTEKSEEKKNKTKEEKLKLKTENEAIVKEYGWCIIDGHKQRIGNFKIEPPGMQTKMPTRLNFYV